MLELCQSKFHVEIIVLTLIKPGFVTHLFSGFSSKKKWQIAFICLRVSGKGTGPYWWTTSLSTHHYIDILRYWNASIRHEESLATRPKAIRIGGPTTFNWQRPVGNHSYFKTPRAGGASKIS